MDTEDIVSDNDNTPFTYVNSLCEVCSIHNENYTRIYRNSLYCDKCKYSLPDKSVSIEEWKKRTLIEMKNFEDKLNNKIKGLNCIMEITMIDRRDHREIIKQIEDIIDTIFVDISHIYNFNKIINDNDNDNNIPISNIIKRKNQILDNKIVISIPNIASYITSFDDKILINYIKMIIKNDGDIHYNDDYIFQIASKNGHLNVVKCLIKYGADIHAQNDLALRWASGSGKLDVVKCLIEHGADIHADNEYALRYASGNGHLEVVECLITHGANVHVLDEYAFRWASENGHLDVVKCLVKYGANVHAMNDHALYWASRNNYPDVVEYLVQLDNNPH